MTRPVPRFIAAATGLACAALAYSAPVVINSEQRAASAVVGAASIAHLTPHYQSLVSTSVQIYALVALNSLNQVTTPAALMATSSGITIPCETSGTFTARLAPRKPRVLKFEWHDCHFPQYGWPTSVDGPGEILLLSDTFSPTTVGMVRFGDAQRDLVQTRELVTADQTNHDTWRRNLRVTGLFPLVNFAGAGNAVPFAYVVTGFIDETNELSFPDREPQTYGSRILMEHVTYAGGTRYDETLTVVDNDLRVLFGEFSFEARLPPPYIGGIEKFRYNNLRVRQVVDYGADWDRTLTLDGNVDYQWFTTRRPGCLSGGYSFKTLAPLHNSLSYPERFDSGVLDTNGKLRTSFYSPLNVPPGLPVPLNGSLLQNKVNGVGTFNYDVDSSRVGLWSVSNCDG